jgi:hypothetical protein
MLRLSNADLNLLLKIAEGTEMQRRIESKLKNTKNLLHEVQEKGERREASALPATIAEVEAMSDEAVLAFIE